LLAGRSSSVSSALAENVPNPDDDIANLQPGQFFWHPERAPIGPVAIIVSIPKQLVFAYRNRHFDRRLDLLNGEARPFDTDWGLHHSAEGKGAHLGHLRRANAGHAAGWGPISVNTISNNSSLPGLAADLDLDIENGPDLIVCRLQKVSDDIQKIVER
jgi:hypothetical protein